MKLAHIQPILVAQNVGVSYNLHFSVMPTEDEEIMLVDC